MPVRRLRSLEEAEATTWLAPTDPRLWPTIATVWALAARLCPPRFPRGVYRHRSVTELNRQTERWEAERSR
jgi:hypothetical protein